MAVPLDAGWPDLAPRLASAERLLVGLDFDGTLAPLAPSPALAELPSEVRDLLAALRDKAGVTVAVISGRALDDLQRKVSLGGLYLAGNHGLEGAGPDWSYRDPDAADFQDAIGDLDAQLRLKLSNLAGVIIENKHWSLAVHYRQSSPDDAAKVIETVEGLTAARPNLRCRPGHQVREVRPRLNASKGTILERLATHLGIGAEQILYAGDDGTDEEAFEVCHAGVTIRVGPPEVQTAARWRVDEPTEVRDMLAHLLHLR